MPPTGPTLPPAAADSPASFERRLHTVICDIFDANSLGEVLQLDLGVVLGHVIEPDAFKNVATDFIGWANREDRLAEFLDKAVANRPRSRELAALRDEHLAATAPPGGLSSGQVEQAVGRFAGRFRERRVWLQYLKAYKQLHEILHDLNGYLGQVRKEADARRASGTPVSGTTAAALRRWAAEAARWWRRTEQPDAVPLWVTQLAQATDAFLGLDPAPHPRALARLASLPATHLLGLNSELLKCAGRLQADELLADLDTVYRLIGPGAAAPLAAVAAAVDDFRAPCGGLSQAIRHDTLCQNIDTELRAAQGQTAKTPDDILGWDVVRDGLDTLDRERPGDLKTAAAVSAAAAFVAAPAPATFDRLMEAFEVLFKAMDVALLSVTTDLLLAGNQLSDSLEGRE